MFPETAKNLLESWSLEKSSKTYKRYWPTLAYAVVRSIWEERNNRCFRNRSREVEEVGELIKVTVAWWIKYRQSGSPYSTTTISRYTKEVRVHS